MEGKRFARSKNAMIFGVCAGLAEYSGVNTDVMRILWALLAILISWLALAAYVALAIVMLPPEGVPASDRFWHHVQGRSIMLVFALVLIGIGVQIILRYLIGWDLFRYIVPIGLITVGALMMAFAFGGRRDKRQ